MPVAPSGPTDDADDDTDGSVEGTVIPGGELVDEPDGGAAVPEVTDGGWDDGTPDPDVALPATLDEQAAVSTAINRVAASRRRGLRDIAAPYKADLSAPGERVPPGIVRVHPATNTVSKLRPPDSTSTLCTGEGGLWVSGAVPGAVTPLDPSSGATLATSRPKQRTFLAVDAGSVRAINDNTGIVKDVTPRPTP